MKKLSWILPHLQIARRAGLSRRNVLADAEMFSSATRPESFPARRINRTLWILSLLVVLSIVGCDKDNNGPDPNERTGLEILEVPGTLLANIDSTYTVRVRVADEGVDPVTIRCVVRFPEGSVAAAFDLYDDGGTTVLSDIEVADSLSGDVVPNNDTYTRTFNGRLLTDSVAGEYTFEFSVPDQSDPIYTKTETVLAANIEECNFLRSAPVNSSGLVGCFDPWMVEVTVDATSPDGVDSVFFYVNNPPDVEIVHFNQQPDTANWRLVITPSTFPCLNGAYVAGIKAFTHFGLTCSLAVNGFEITTDDQQLSHFIGLPDTIYRPMPGDTDILVVAVDLEDCNLLGVLGYDGVRFDVKRDAFDWFHGADYFLNDSNLLGDTTAGDGTYSVGLEFLNSDSLFNNLYIFRYYSVECAPPYPQTDYIYDTVRVIQENSAIQFPVSPDHPLGFSIVPHTDITSAGDRR